MRRSPMNPPCDFKRQRIGPVSSFCTKSHRNFDFVRSKGHRCTEPITSFRCLAVDGETKPGLPLREAPCSSSIIFDLDHEALELLSSQLRTFARNFALVLHHVSHRELYFQTAELHGHFSVPLNQRARHSPRSVVGRDGERVAQLAVSRRGRCFVVCASRLLGGAKKHRAAVAFCVSVASYLLSRVQIAAPICAAGPVALLVSVRRISASAISRLARGVVSGISKKIEVWGDSPCAFFFNSAF